MPRKHGHRYDLLKEGGGGLKLRRQLSAFTNCICLTKICTAVKLAQTEPAYNEKPSLVCVRGISSIPPPLPPQKGYCSELNMKCVDRNCVAWYRLYLYTFHAYPNTLIFLIIHFVVYDHFHLGSCSTVPFDAAPPPPILPCPLPGTGVAPQNIFFFFF